MISAHEADIGEESLRAATFLLSNASKSGQHLASTCCHACSSPSPAENSHQSDIQVVHRLAAGLGSNTFMNLDLTSTFA